MTSKTTKTNSKVVDPSKKKSAEKTSKTTKTISKIVDTSKNECDINFAEMFDFFARIVKLIVLRKDDTDVIAKYSTWLDALRKHPDAKLRYDYVKLLVMGLEHPVSVCPFNDYPPAAIEPLDCGWTETVRNVFSDRDDEPGPCRPAVLNPPVVTAVSDDRRRFAAYQKVPGAGVQVFYAQSDDPLYEWFFKRGSASTQPDHPVQARSLDWERSLAGIRTGNALERSPAALTSQFEEKVPDPCVILETDQENMKREVEKFKWNAKSLLTGDTVPGSDLCIDWMISEHDKTQLEIDEEMVRSFDKLYPDSFRLIANPELLEGIVGQMDCAKENAEFMDEACETVQPDICYESNRQCAGNDQNSALSKPSEKRSSSECLLTGTCDGESLDGTSAKDLKNYRTQRPIVDCARNDVKIYPDALPSFKRAANSFHSIATKAEDTMKEVNEWLSGKQRKLY